jgi:hypothetical protein
MGAHDDLVTSWQREFRDAHEEDDRNAARQSFDDYWSWVKTFFVTGGAGQRGWLDQSEDVLKGIKSAPAARELRGRLVDLGKSIAAEWAKDSRARRIHSTLLQGTPNLFAWGRQLQRAAAADTGDGKNIAQALDAIERDVRAARRA